MLNSGSVKKERKNPNDPARFIEKIAATDDGEAGHKIPYSSTAKQIPTTRVNKGIVENFIFTNCQRWDYNTGFVFLHFLI